MTHVQWSMDLQGAKFIIKVPVKASLSLIDKSSDPNYSLRSLTKPFLIGLQPCAIENLHLGVAKQVSVAVGWVKIKILLMAQLKGLTAKFKLM